MQISNYAVLHFFLLFFQIANFFSKRSIFYVNYSRFQKRELLGKYLLLLAEYIYQALRAVPALFFYFLIFQHFFSNTSYIQCRIVISINFNSAALTFITSLRYFIQKLYHGCILFSIKKSNSSPACRKPTTSYYLFVK